MFYSGPLRRGLFVRLKIHSQLSPTFFTKPKQLSPAPHCGAQHTKLSPLPVCALLVACVGCCQLISSSEAVGEEKRLWGSWEWDRAAAAMGWFTNLVVVMSCVASGLVLYPVQIADSGAGEQSGVTLSGIVRLVHLLSFATAFGTSVWASFIGGIIMFKNLPRHQFGNLQAKMFPAYFKLLIICCSLCVSAMATTHPWKTATKREQLQIVALGVSLFTVLVNLLVFQPLTVKIMKQRHKIEKEEGIGTEVGWSKNVEAAKKNQELAKMNKTFGMVHGFSSLANIFCFGGLAFHSWYIASRMLL